MILQRSLAILERLIAFPTVSRDSNLDLIGYAKDLLAAHGVETRLIHDETGRKANLYAVLGPKDRAGILLSGHTDVVPVDGQNWSTDPFRLSERNGRLYGRGSADMKGFIACVLAAVEAAANQPLKQPLHLSFSYDEEIGCVGVRRLIDALAGMAPLPYLCVVGEPTSMQTVLGHKGKTGGRVVCLGHECHSSHAPEGLNAIHLGGEMIGVLRGLQDEILRDGRQDPDYAVPFTTVHVGTIHGGTAVNIVPARCELDFEIRYVQGDDPNVLLDRLFDRAAALSREATVRFPGTGIEIAITNSYPGLETAPDDPIVATVRRLSATERDGSASKTAFGTEGGLFRHSLGIPSVICGPGNIREAHKPDEYVERDQIARCAAMMERLVGELAA